MDDRLAPAAVTIAATPRPMRTISRYTISDKLGSGGMGDVYLAEDPSLGRKVALKILPQQFTQDASRLQRFQSEARTVSALNHPNILTIFEIGEADGEHFIVTEFIDGETLRRRLARGPLSVSEVIDIGSGVLSALVEAHAAGVIHRDIKPENVMIRRDGLIKVLDFGLAKRTEPSAAQSEAESRTAIRSTAPGTVLGTVSYMSPEQARGLAVDVRTDLFSLGAMLYEMLTGRVPFEGETSTDILSAILQRKPLPMSRYTPDVMHEMQWIVEKALHKDRDERYQTAREMLADLRRVPRGDHAQPPGADQKTQEVRSATSSPGTIPSSVSVSSAEYLISGIREHRKIFGGSIIALLLAAATLIYFTTKASATIDSVAVLPFENQSGDPNADYVADGVTENLINSLSGIKDLRVVPRSSVFRYKESELSIEQIAKELSARAVLTGRLRKQGNSYTVQVELVDAATLSQLWGERFDAPGGDLMLLEQGLARNAAAKLRPTMTAAEHERVEAIHTSDPVAHDLYLRGRYHWHQRKIEGLRMALGFFQKAIDRDPEFAMAWSGLADVYVVLPNYDEKLVTRDAYPKAREAAARALALDPGLVEPHATLAGVLFEYEFNVPAAEREFQRAIELNPHYATARHWYAEMLSGIGRSEEALIQAEAARAADPLSVVAANSVAFVHTEARNPDEALRAVEKVAELDPEFPTIPLIRSLAYVQKGMLEEGAASGELFSKAINDEALLVWPLVLRGRKSEALQLIAKFEKLASEGQYSPYILAGCYALVGDADSSIRWLEKAYEARAAQFGYVAVNSFFDPVRSDPRFGDFLRRVGLPGDLPYQSEWGRQADIARKAELARQGVSATRNTM